MGFAGISALALPVRQNKMATLIAQIPPRRGLWHKRPCNPSAACAGTGGQRGRRASGESAEIAGDQNALLQHDVQIAVRPIFQVLHGRQSKLVRVLDKIVQRGRRAGSRPFFDRPLAGFALQNAGAACHRVGRQHNAIANHREGIHCSQPGRKLAHFIRPQSEINFRTIRKPVPYIT